MGRRGILKKSIGVFSNDPEKRTEQLLFEASIKPIFRITPSSTVSLTGKRGELKSAEVLITAGLNKPLNIGTAGFTIDDSKISYKLETVEAGKQYRVVFRNNPGSTGNFNGELRLKTNLRKNLL
jgi:ABC-type antimicrobial peptide transport system ATPase subunit